jgi:UDP-N-acetylglucosamine--N-acetylmuramyl-(pentapeptide) pyrophosphoryl-undecaprenol N-acetylglucosamine transferase
MQTMKVLFAGGGTAGHINPALSIAEYIKLKMPQADIRFAGNPQGMEFKLVPQAGYQIYPIEVRGFRRKISFYNVGTVSRLFTSLRQAEKIIKEFKPDLVVGTGGFVSGPILYKAAKMNIPTAIHEQNSYPGITTKILSRYVDKIMLTTEDAKKYISNPDRCVVTGMPVREDFKYYKKEKARLELELDSRPVILSFGGSLGARVLNDAIIDLIASDWKSGKVQHIHATGNHYYTWFLECLKQKGVEENQPHIRIKEYINDMPRCFAAADLIICRCGASTLCQLQVQGKPSILVPSPNVTENHQYHNAVSLEKRGAAIIIEDKNLTGKLLDDTLQKLISNPKALKSMGEAAYRMAVFDANDRIFEVLTSITK